MPSGPQPTSDAVSNAAAASPHAVAKHTRLSPEPAADARARADPGALPAPSPPTFVRAPPPEALACPHARPLTRAHSMALL